MKKTLLTYLLLIIQSGIFAQLVIPVEIQHNDIITQQLRNSNINYLTFDNAVNISEFGSFPLYYTEIELPGEFFSCEVEIKPINSDTLTQELSNTLTDNDIVKNEFISKVIIKGTKAGVYVLPFRWDSLNNSIIRLSEFELLADFVPIENNIKVENINIRYQDESVLASGSWVKFGIIETGVHKMNYSDILDFGFNPDELDVNKIGIFGNYSGVLPETNSKSRKDDLQENSIMIVGIEDGSFDTEDYILYFAQAPTTWSYNPFTGRFGHETNIYSDTTYYFFTPDRGNAKPISQLEGNAPNPTHFVTSFTDYKVHELESENMISSGKQWYGERFEGDTLEREFSFSFPNIIKDEPVFLGSDIIGRSFVDSYYDMMVNETSIVDSTRIRFISASLGIFARTSSTSKTFFTDNDNLTVKIKFMSEDPNAIAWLDYIQINAIRELKFTGNQMMFCNPHISALGNVTEFTVGQTSENDMVWDITDIHNPRNIITSYNDGNISYSIPTDSLKNFTIINGSEYFKHISSEDIPNQNLHGISNVNFVIIRPDIFENEANRLAEIHRNHDGLSTVTLSLNQIYNEFSSGSQDISGIRDFMRMLYKKGAFGNERAYLMLFGDASFDYKHRIHGNTNMVPTYESAESLRETGSFVTDDFFGLLDDSEGASASGDLDIGIGRFPISTIDEAKSAVDKIENYLSKKEGIMADWRTNICFVADDRDNNLHLKQAENLILIADTVHSGLGINKIFLDAYTKVTVPGGFRYPDVNTKINQQMEEGALIVNYTGHGGLIGWSDELVLDVPMINAFDNYENLPLIITATCEFSRFDDPEFTSAGEYTFLNQHGGAIGLLTTTRLAYAHANYIVNSRIYANLLSCDDEGNRPRLGDLVRLSKIPSNENYLNFVLLGDPALTLAYPTLDVITTQSKTIEAGINDTVRALTIVSVSGEIKNDSKQTVDSFNGYVYPKVVDKASKYTTLGNDGNSYPQDFTIYDKVLYDGKVSVIDGKFSFEFMVPKDISYQYGYGKIRYYALDTVNYIDAWGAFEELVIGGIDENADIDDIGPEIDIFLNDNSFNTGDIVNNNPVLLSYIADDHGINNTGNGLGRDIIMIIDNDNANPMIMNNIFEMDLDSYKKGKIIYPFNNLEDGIHTITIKAWDLQNNSSEKTIEFIVNDAADINLSEVYNFPNPFIDFTEFKYVHNKNGSILSTIIKIYDLTGKLVVELIDDNNITSGSTGSIIWDGKNQNNETVTQGIYVYTIEVNDEYNNVTVQQQKLFKINK